MFQISNNIYQGKEYFGWTEKQARQWAVVTLVLSPGEIPLPMIQFRFPIEDGPFPGLVWLKMVVSCTEELDKADYKIYICDQTGMSRSVLVTAAFLMKKYNLSRDAALEIIKKANADIFPSQSFLAGLLKWEEYLRSTNGTSRPDNFRRSV